MSKNLIESLKRIMRQKSPAEVAVLLGYKDTRALYMWITRKKIPESKREKVMAIVKEHLCD